MGATQASPMETAKTFFIALQGQPPGTSMESARLIFFIKKKKSPKVKALPPTSANLFLHMLRANLSIMLEKAADRQASPDESADSSQIG